MRTLSEMNKKAYDTTLVEYNKFGKRVSTNPIFGVIEFPFKPSNGKYMLTGLWGWYIKDFTPEEVDNLLDGNAIYVGTHGHFMTLTRETYKINNEDKDKKKIQAWMHEKKKSRLCE